MGLSCKPTGKFKSVLTKIENAAKKRAEEKKTKENTSK
jgi:hypothetical protein